ncbi:CLUMA_CG017323, isoform A [Clunio marinus]|uniref:CLUMA_CG017323, isoform A n=1 Tax=Clunio marinus TaxID=568069 RepID=A0A1J1IWZ0_9DIPT|nr:CLUMA_CG017323, isoform A [Clunio marinus]
MFNEIILFLDHEVDESSTASMTYCE